jgi:hypothetical protein
MAGDVKDLNPANYASHTEAEDLTDRGDEVDQEALDAAAEAEAAAVAKHALKKATPAKKEAEPEKDTEEEESEKEDDDDEAEEGRDDTRGKRVPYKRFAKQKEQRVAAENRAEEAEQRLREIEASRTAEQRSKAQQLSDHLSNLYDKVEEHRAKGETKEASKFQREIDEIRDNMTRSQAAHFAARAAVDESNVRVYNTMVRELEAIDPRFDKTSDDHDPDLVEEVADLIDAFEAKGMAAPDALRRAAKSILRQDVFAVGGAKSLKKAEPRKTDVAKNLAAAKRQAPDEPGLVKEKAGKVDVSKLTEAEFDALPEETRKRYRGDELE